MADGTCSVAGCERSRGTKGFCDLHYRRWRRHGDPGGALPKALLPVRLCTVAGCDQPHDSRGYCNGHYLRWRKYGDPGGLLRPTALAERFWQKVQVGASDECWPWIASIRPDGYGGFGVGQSTHLPHRIAYELARGPIPDGLVLDHLCHNPNECAGGRGCQHRRCVNPRHLEPVEFVENVMRGASFTARNARKTHCPQGHAFTDENTYRWQGKNSRACRTCMSTR